MEGSRTFQALTYSRNNQSSRTDWPLPRSNEAPERKEGVSHAGNSANNSESLCGYKVLNEGAQLDELASGKSLRKSPAAGGIGFAMEAPACTVTCGWRRSSELRRRQRVSSDPRSKIMEPLSPALLYPKETRGSRIGAMVSRKI
jgi:hypothetical protein